MAELSGENNQVNIKLNVDTSDAVNSIKKLQRIARETVKNLKEVDSLSGLKRYSSEELAEELATRFGVEHLIILSPEEYAKMSYNRDKKRGIPSFSELSR